MGEIVTTDEVKAFSKAIRIEALKMVHASNSSHLGGAFSMADILAVLYGGVMNVNPKNPRWPERDRFLLSKGHACSALYAALALRGFFDMSQLTSFAQNGSFFTSHANHH
ncbi:MAG TPA: transketolase, partial [bacterium]|nr:transketolase [bacterium]